MTLGDNPSVASPAPASSSNHITEDEASLYDRQIRLWGLDAQTRMRNSTVLILSLRSLAHETIKNLVLAGIGRLIIMDSEVVDEEDLSGGFLFREEEGAVGKNRTEAALAQIKSLNPLVDVTAIPSCEPFPVSGESDEAEMISFLQKEKVDVIVACDLKYKQMVAVNAAAHKAKSMFYGAGTFGFFGYIFADLGDTFNFSYTAPNRPQTEETLTFKPMDQALDRSNWTLSYEKTAEGGSPFGGYKRVLRARQFGPQICVPLLAVWEYENQFSRYPNGGVDDEKELKRITSELQSALGVHPKLLDASDAAVSHLAAHSMHFFPPTLAIVGGLLAQDVLRSISRNGWPIINLLAIDTMSGVAVSAPFGVKADPSTPM